MKDPMDDFRTNYFQAIRDMVNYSFLHFFSVKNCKILDIGVDGDLSTSKEFIKKGASQVIAVNSYEFNSDITVPNNIVYLKKGAEDVDYPDGYFDIIYGNSVLEHINGFDNFLDKMLTLLEKDGVIYLEGAPFWTCPVGHHLFVSTDDKLYTFSDNCPIKKYEHLIYDKNTMMEALATRSIPKSHIEKIVDFVYESVLLNRIKPSQIKEMIKKKGYTCFFYETFFQAIQVDNCDKLRSKFSDYDLLLDKMEVVIIKGKKTSVHSSSAIKKLNDFKVHHNQLQEGIVHKVMGKLKKIISR